VAARGFSAGAVDGTTTSGSVPLHRVTLLKRAWSAFLAYQIQFFPGSHLLNWKSRIGGDARYLEYQSRWHVRKALALRMYPAAARPSRYSVTRFTMAPPALLSCPLSPGRLRIHSTTISPSSSHGDSRMALIISRF
jgi:hypothetical protein